MDDAGDFAERCVRTTLGFHWARSAVGLPRLKDDAVGSGDVLTLILEGSSFAAQ